VSAGKCKGCGAAFRKGKRRGVLGEDGTVTVALVCGPCASRSFSVVRPIGDAAQQCTVCNAAPARLCHGCVAKARSALVDPILAQLRGASNAFRLDGQQANADAYEHAILALQREAGR